MSKLLEVKQEPKNVIRLQNATMGIRCVKMRHELCANVVPGRNVCTMCDEVPQCLGTSSK
jgi:hypothetical protein